MKLTAPGFFAASSMNTVHLTLLKWLLVLLFLA
jgi:hypothetical protein